MIGWIAVLINIVGLILIGRKNHWGWVFGITAEVLWIIRAQSMNMPDLVFISLVYIGVATWNWIEWGRK